jgi:hypothetical protein
VPGDLGADVNTQIDRHGIADQLADLPKIRSIGGWRELELWREGL